jgi:hypothetical protein
MKSPSAPTLHALQRLRQASVSVAALCDSIILGGDTNRNNAIPLLPQALRILRERVDRALEVLAQEGRPRARGSGRRRKPRANSSA